jgi:hypothetical protein
LKIKKQNTKEFLESLNKEMVRQGNLIRKDIKKAAKNAEPLIKKTREALLKFGKDTQKNVKKAYKDAKRKS